MHNILFLQHLTLGSLIRVFAVRSQFKSIILLDNPDWSRPFYILLLKILSLKVRNAEFSIADLNTPDGEAVLLKSLKETTPVAEQEGRREGYLLNHAGSLLQYVIEKLFRRHFCNLYVVNCSNALPDNGTIWFPFFDNA